MPSETGGAPVPSSAAVPTGVPVPGEQLPAETPTTEPSPANVPTPTPSVSATPTPTKVAEPSQLPKPADIQSAVPEVDKAALVEEPPAVPTPATQDDVADTVNAIMAAQSNRGNGSHDGDHDGNHNGGHDGNGNGNGNGNHDGDHQGPGGHNPGGWSCDDPRGPRSCQWNDWDHDDHGRPVFYNRYDFDLRVQFCDPNTGQVYTVLVRAGSRRPIDVPHAGDYGFVVVGVNAPNVAVNVGFGMFNSGGQCNQYCSVPSRPGVNLNVRVNVLVGNVYQPYYVPSYDCGCGPIYTRDNRDYYRYYFNGNREVVGYWEAPPNQERYFVPVEQRQSPVAPVLTPVTAQNLREVLGTGEDEPLGGNPSASQFVSDHAREFGFGAIVVIVLGLGGAAAYVYFQRRRSA